MKQLQDYLYYRESNPDIEIYLGDCLEILPLMEKENVNLVITDPPYGKKLDLKWLSQMNLAQGKNANKSDERILNDEGNLYLDWIFEFKKFIIFGFPYIQNLNGKASGWLVWDKQPGIDRRGIITPVEMAMTNCWTGFDIIRCMWSGYYRDNNEFRYKHPTQKPLKLFKILIQENSKEINLILDPFLGSGTTLVACKELNRYGIGIEISEEYCKIAVNRLKNTQRMML